MSYTIIRHKERVKLDLSINEYCVADLVYQLSSNPENSRGWCYASKEWMGKQLGFSRRSIINLINKLIDKGIVIKNEETNDLKTTNLWNVTVPPRGAEFAQGVKKVYTGCEESSQVGCETSSHNNNNIYNNKDNKSVRKYNTLEKYKAGKDEIIPILKDKYPNLDVATAYEDLIYWCESTGRKYSDYLATVKNWLRKNSKNQYTKNTVANYKRLN